MTETTMPAAEAEAVAVDDRNSYELAFHVLPTVAEGEVAEVFAKIKDQITKTGAEIFDEEAPERFDLAYEVVLHYEGKNRKFNSAYFGWVRFKAPAESVTAISESAEENSSLLRHLLIKLTKVEEANPFRFHESLAKEVTITDIPEAPVVDPDAVLTKPPTEEESGDADEDEIDEALDKNEV